MCYGVLTSNGDALVDFFDVPNVSAPVYLDVLQNHIVPWIEQSTDGQDYTYIQDGGSSAVDGSVPARNGPVQNRPRGDPYPTRVLFVGPGIWVKKKKKSRKIL
jgi:hypothetical protein